MENGAMAIPIFMAQVEAAQQLYSRLARWQTTDRALELLGERFPGFRTEETLLKVAAVNALYGTNLYAVDRMAQHIEAVIRDVGTGVPDLVERIARLPHIKTEEKDRKHYSFASKFAHFFVDGGRFPIYDYYAARMVKYHLGRNGLVQHEGNPYRSFAASFTKLKDLLGFQLTTRQLDRYLWLAGQYRDWKAKGGELALNAELRRLFEESEPAVVSELTILLGPERSWPRP